MMHLLLLSPHTIERLDLIRETTIAACIARTKFEFEQSVSAHENFLAIKHYLLLQLKSIRE